MAVLFVFNVSLRLSKTTLAKFEKLSYPSCPKSQAGECLRVTNVKFTQTKKFDDTKFS